MKPQDDYKPSKVETMNVLKQMRLLQSQAHTSRVNNIATDSDIGPFIFTSSDDLTVKRWDIESGQVLNNYPHPSAVTALDFCKLRRTLVTGCADGVVRQIDISSGTVVSECHYDRENQGAVLEMVILDSGTVFVAGMDNRIKWFDLESGRLMHVIGGHDDLITAMAKSQDETFMLTASRDCSVKKWPTNGALHISPPLAEVYRHDQPVRCVRVSPSSDKFYSSCGNEIYVWKVKPKSGSGNPQQTPMSRFIGHENLVNCIDLSGDGRAMVTSSVDGSVKEWDLRSEMCTQVVKVFKAEATCVAYGDKNHFFAADATGKIIRGKGTGGGAVEHLNPVETTTFLAQYGNIYAFELICELAVVLVQYVQILAFVLTRKLLWDNSIYWVPLVMSPIQLSIPEIRLLPSITEEVVVVIVTGGIVWAFAVACLFYLDVYPCIHDFAVWTQPPEQKTGSKRQILPLAQRASRPPAQSWRWSKRRSTEAENETQLSRICASLVSSFLWLFFWVNVSLLAIPLVGLLTFASLHANLEYQRTSAWVALLLFALVFLLLRLSNGSISQFLHLRRTRQTQHVGVCNMRGFVQTSNMGPLTTKRWETHVYTTCITLAFAIVNSVSLLRSFEERTIVCGLNLAMSVSVLAVSWYWPRYSSSQMNGILFGLQCFQAWNTLLAFVTALVNDTTSNVVGALWYFGLCVFVASAIRYGLKRRRTTRKPYKKKDQLVQKLQKELIQKQIERQRSRQIQGML